jgi:N-terminal region of Chorein or VPS13
MFEGKVLELVKKYLDRYVENLDGDVLKVGLLSGTTDVCS